MDELEKPIIVKKENVKHLPPDNHSDEDDGVEEPHDDYLGDDPTKDGDNDGGGDTPIFPSLHLLVGLLT